MTVQKISVKTSEQHRKKRLYLTILGSIVVFIFLLSTLTSTIVFNFIQALFWAIIFCFIFPSVYNVMNLMKMKYELKRQDFGHIQGECELTVNEKKLLKETKNLREEVRWDDIQEMREDNDRFIFYLTKIKVFMIKKSPIDMNPQEIKQYRQYIYSEIYKHKIKEK